MADPPRIRVFRISRPSVRGEILIVNDDRSFVMFDSGCSGWIEHADLEVEALAP